MMLDGAPGVSRKGTCSMASNSGNLASLEERRADAFNQLRELREEKRLLEPSSPLQGPLARHEQSLVGLISELDEAIFKVRAQTS